MNEADDAILELLSRATVDGHALALPPSVVAVNLQAIGALDRAPNTIARRMSKLNEAGLIKRVDDRRGYYRITDRGKQYLAEQLTADEIPSPD